MGIKRRRGGVHATRLHQHARGEAESPISSLPPFVGSSLNWVKAERGTKKGKKKHAKTGHSGTCSSCPATGNYKGNVSVKEIQYMSQDCQTILNSLFI